MMDNQENVNRAKDGDFFPILVLNCIMWASASIIANLDVVHGIREDAPLYSVLLVGTVIPIVAVSKAWRVRKRTAS